MRTHMNLYDFQYRQYLFKRVILGIFLIMALFISFITSILLGPYKLSVSEFFRYIWAVMFRSISVSKDVQIVYELRLCRALTAVLVGAILGVSGAIMQCVLRNPLASPYTLGVNQGAALGAAIAIVYMGGGVLTKTGEGIIISQPYLIPGMAFMGAMISVAIILALARIRDLTPVGLILGGVATASFFQALLFMIQYFSTDVQVAAITFWMFGDLGRAYWDELFLIFIANIVLVMYALYRVWSYNALLLGDEIAKTLNADPKRIRLESMLVVAVGNAIAVSFVGIIGFLGLIAPHIIRMIIGGNHKHLIPYSAVLGASLLLAADVLGRVIIAPRTLPVGIITTLLGVPMLIYLIVRRGDKY